MNRAIHCGILCLATLLLVGAGRTVRAQAPGVGVTPFRPDVASRIRLSGGLGFNVGYANEMPFASVGMGTFDLGGLLLGGAFNVASGTGFGPPRRSLFEADALVGVGSDEILPRYEATPHSFYASAMTGLGVINYSERWRFGRGRRGFFDTTSYYGQPNISVSSLALPVYLQVVYEPMRFVAIGLSASAAISTLRPSYTVAAILQARY